MSIFQILALLFALMMMYVVNIHRKKARLSLLEVSFWMSTWFVFIVIAIFPNLLTGIAGILNFSRVFDLLVVIAFMVVSWLVFRSYLIEKENTRKIDELVRKQAILRHEKTSKK
jgi:hypothetical protein